MQDHSQWSLWSYSCIMFVHVCATCCLAARFCERIRPWIENVSSKLLAQSRDHEGLLLRRARKIIVVILLNHALWSMQMLLNLHKFHIQMTSSEAPEWFELCGWILWHTVQLWRPHFPANGLPLREYRKVSQDSNIVFLWLKQTCWESHAACTHICMHSTTDNMNSLSLLRSFHGDVNLSTINSQVSQVSLVALVHPFRVSFVTSCYINPLDSLDSLDPPYQSECHRQRGWH